VVGAPGFADVLAAEPWPDELQPAAVTMAASTLAAMM